jgi:hypothetical protein
MRFGNIGADNIGRALARHVVKAGYPVSNSRGPQTLTDVVAELGALSGARSIRHASAAPRFGADASDVCCYFSRYTPSQTGIGDMVAAIHRIPALP